MAINRRTLKNGETRWQVVIPQVDPVTGRTVRVTVGTYPQKKRAQREERLALEAIEDGTFVQRRTDTVAELLRLWLESVGVGRNTLVGYRTAVEKYWIPALGVTRAQSLSPEMVQHHINQWTGQGLYRTAQVNYRVLRAACDHGVAMKILSTNPCIGVKVARNPEPKARTIWSEPSVQRFLTAAEDDDLSLLWFLFLETGLRRGEALGLHWNNVDWESSSIRIAETAVQDKTGTGRGMVIQPMGKTDGARRVILISDDLLQRFRTWRRSHTTSPLVFPSPLGKPLTADLVARRLDALAERAGVERVTIHELRHIAATRMMRAGIPYVVAKQRMGHVGDLLRKVYQHADADSQREAVAALERLTVAGRTEEPRAL